MRPGANGVVELSPFESLDRLTDLVPPPRKAAAQLMQNPARTTHRANAWAKLMARVGEEFPLACPGCGGNVRLIAFITEPGPIRKILTRLASRS